MSERSGPEDQGSKNEEHVEMEGGGSPETRSRKREREEEHRHRERSNSSSGSDSERRDRYKRERRSPSSPQQKRRKRDDWSGGPDHGRAGQQNPRFYDDRRRKSFPPRNALPPMFNPSSKPDSYNGNKARMNEAVLYEGGMKSLHQFIELEGRSPDIEKRYEEYKQEYQRRSARNFFNEHKNDEWFRERYDPTYIEARRKEKIEFSKQQVEVFEKALQNGTLVWKIESEETKTDETDANIEEHEEMETGEKEETKEGKEEKDTGAQESTKQGSSTGGEDVEVNAVFVKAVPPTIGRRDLVQTFQSCEGYLGVALSELNLKYNSFNRFAWVIFQTKDQCLKVVDEFNGKKVKEVELALSLNRTGFVKKPVRLTPFIASLEKRIEADFENAKKLVNKLDQEKEITNPLFKNTQFDSLPIEEQLDKLITYLRQVHLFCFYCVEEFDNEYDMRRKCGIKHCRRKRLDETSMAAKTNNVLNEKWIAGFEGRIRNRLEHAPNYDLLTGKVETENQLERFFKEHVLPKDKDKFRCKECQKLFSGDNFVRKHLKNKHIDLIEIVNKKAFDHQFFENYFRDPKKSYLISPTSTSVLSFPPAPRGVPPLGMGASRGFPNQPGHWNVGPPDARPGLLRSPQPPPVPPSAFAPPMFSRGPAPIPIPSRSLRTGYTGTGPANLNPLPGRPNSTPPFLRGPPPRQRGLEPQHPSPRQLISNPPLSQPTPSSQQNPPASDPRAASAISYVDLDAPKEESVQIDYRTAVDYSDF